MLTYDGFTTIVLYLLESAWGQNWGTFTEESPQLSDSNNITFPRVVYSIEEASPAVVGKDGTREIRPRIREIQEVELNGQGPSSVYVYGQRMDYYVSFTVYAENNRQLDIMTERFMELMMTYSGFICKQGLHHFFFDRMKRKTEGEKDHVVSRTLYYRVGFERITVNPTEQIRRIETQVLENLGE